MTRATESSSQLSEQTDRTSALNAVLCELRSRMDIMVEGPDRIRFRHGGTEQSPHVLTYHIAPRGSLTDVAALNDFMSAFIPCTPRGIALVETQPFTKIGGRVCFGMMMLEPVQIGTAECRQTIRSSWYFAPFYEGAGLIGARTQEGGVAVIPMYERPVFCQVVLQFYSDYLQLRMRSRYCRATRTV